MAVALSDVQLRKEEWESLGADFGLGSDGSLDLTYTGSLMYDVHAKESLFGFLTNHRRDMHALVLANGDSLAVNRLEFARWLVSCGRVQDE